MNWTDPWGWGLAVGEDMTVWEAAPIYFFAFVCGVDGRVAVGAVDPAMGGLDSVSALPLWFVNENGDVSIY